MRLLATFLTALAVLAVAAAPSAAAKKRDRCAKRGTTTVKKNRYVRVYTGAVYHDDQGVPTDSTYACLRRTGRRIRLDGNASVELRRLTGVWIAYETAFSPGIDTAFYGVVVRSVKTRRVVAACSYGGTQVDPSISRVVLRRDGAAAWVAQNDLSEPWKVNASNGDGECGVELDSGRGIDPASLRLRGDTLSWLNDGVTRTAPVAAP